MQLPVLLCGSSRCTAAASCVAPPGHPPQRFVEPAAGAHVKAVARFPEHSVR